MIKVTTSTDKTTALVSATATDEPAGVSPGAGMARP